MQLTNHTDSAPSLIREITNMLGQQKRKTLFVLIILNQNHTFTFLNLNINNFISTTVAHEKTKKKLPS